MAELAAACELPITPFGRAGARHLFRDGYRDPFGIAIVPLTMGKLTAGKLLVAEFGNQHGTAAAGTTILQVNPATGKTSVFFRGARRGSGGVVIDPAKSPVATRIVYRGQALQSPENIAIDPRNGDLLVVNANDNRLVVITPGGKLVAIRDLAAHQPTGALFGLAIGTNAAGDLVLYYTNSNTDTLHELVLQAHYAKH